jgi:hypothetical protein
MSMTFMVMLFMIVFMVIMIVFMIIMIVFMIIMIVVVIIMIVFMVIVVIIMIVFMVIVVIIMIVFMVIVVIIDVNLAVKVFCFPPNQSRPNGSFDGERAAITQAPLKNATKHAIDGVVLGIPFKVGVKSTMAFDGDEGREIEFTGLERLSTTMGAMGFGR